MTASTLKLIAIVTMVADHIGYLFFPGAIWLRIVGRIAFPIFAFLTAEGARLTSDRNRYVKRLLLWAVIAEIPFDLMGAGKLFDIKYQNVMWTLAAGVVCITWMERGGWLNWVKIVAVMTVCTVLMTDYMFPGIAAIMQMYRWQKKEKPIVGMLWANLALTLFISPLQIFGYVDVLLIYFYNGKRGIRMKYLFYAFYPAHMLVLWTISQFLARGALPV